MYCSESQRLQTLLNRLLLELHHRGNASGLGIGTGPSMGMGVVPDPFVGREATSAKGNDAYLYILLIMIFYACLAGGSSWPTPAPASSSRPRMSHPWPVLLSRNGSPLPSHLPTRRMARACWLRAATSSQQGRCLRWLRALRGSRSAVLLILLIPGPGSRAFTAVPELALPEAQKMMRGQNPSRQGPGRRSSA
uniref:Uncharacterized protein n=1 Tax=Mus musculus TaxID=10090 RepID=Q8C1K1_MOUSE|nr:unnamed protein product [Mus musculus]